MYLILSGQVGVGKTYVAKMIQRMTGAEVITSDVVRKRLFPQPSYAPGETEAVFNKFYMDARHLLSQGNDVVLDAIFIEQRCIDRVKNELNGSEHYVVRLTCAEEVILQRLQHRKTHPFGDSDADESIYFRMKKIDEHIPADFDIDTTNEQSLEAKVQELITQLPFNDLCFRVHQVNNL